MTDPGYAVHIVDTRSGTIVYNSVPYIGVPQFDRRVNTDGSIKVTLPVQDPSFPTVTLMRAVTTPWRFSIAVSIGTFVLAYGPLMTYKFSQRADTVDLGAGSIWSIFNRRLCYSGAAITSPVSMATSMDGVYGPTSLQGVARGMVSDSIGRGTGFELPIDLPAAIAGTTTQNYPIFDMASVGTRLKDLTAQSGGPDIDWSPYFSDASHIRVTMRIGTPDLAQVGNTLIWDDVSGIVEADVDSSGANMTTSVFTKGNATDRASQIAYTTNTALIAAGWPQLETFDTSHSSVTDFTVLQGYSDEGVAFNKAPEEVWTVTVVCDQSPVVSTYLPGYFASFNMRNHPWIPAGSYTQRILGWKSTGVPNRLSLILQAVQGAV